MKLKSLIFFMLIIVFHSCSQDEIEKANSLDINPPSWIQGTWVAKDKVLGNVRLKFTDTNFLKIDEDGVETNVMFAYVLLQGLGDEVTVEEIKLQNHYAIKISTGYSDHWYRFTKFESGEMSWDNYEQSTESVIYIKE